MIVTRDCLDVDYQPLPFAPNYLVARAFRRYNGHWVDYNPSSRLQTDLVAPTVIPFGVIDAKQTSPIRRIHS